MPSLQHTGNPRKVLLQNFPKGGLVALPQKRTLFHKSDNGQTQQGVPDANAHVRPCTHAPNFRPAFPCIRSRHLVKSLLRALVQEFRHLDDVIDPASLLDFVNGLVHLLLQSRGMCSCVRSIHTMPPPLPHPSDSSCDAPATVPVLAPGLEEAYLQHVHPIAPVQHVLFRSPQAILSLSDSLPLFCSVGGRPQSSRLQQQKVRPPHELGPCDGP